MVKTKQNLTEIQEANSYMIKNIIDKKKDSVRNIFETYMLKGSLSLNYIEVHQFTKKKNNILIRKW